MPRSLRRRTAVVRTAVVLTAATGSLLLLASPALAYHAEVLAVADCTGQVRWAVQSWSGLPSSRADPRATELSRTNPAVAVEWSDGGDRWRGVATAVLGPKDGYTDSGTFQLPAGERPHALQVRATVGRWASGHAGGGQRGTPPQDLTTCAAAAAAPVAVATAVATAVEAAPAAATAVEAPAAVANADPARTTSSGPALPVTLGGGLVGAGGAWLLTRRRAVA